VGAHRMRSSPPPEYKCNYLMMIAKYKTNIRYRHNERMCHKMKIAIVKHQLLLGIG
jgi:hypothetical protein